MTTEERLASLLSHYFRLAWEAAGLSWDPDNEMEVGQIADAVVDIARGEVAAHAENAPHLHRDGSTG